MEIRANEDTSISQDLTPPLRPIAAVLHLPFLSSHCSTCFSTLPQNTPTNPQNSNFTPTFLYCSPSCSSLQFPSSTCLSSSDLRLAFRLLQIFQNSEKKSYQNDAVSERIFGLMTNCEKLMISDGEDQSEMIREGAVAIAKATVEIYGDFDFKLGLRLGEMFYCLVLTNAVEVMDKSNGRVLGVAVYGVEFSWINHSCSPNACYRFLIGPECVEGGSSFKIGSVGCDGGNVHGPRVVVRSIRDVRKGDEVTIAYTDLLQPKELRQSELWLKYRFTCGCKRCGAIPMTYVDHALQAASIIPDQDFGQDNKTEKLMESFDDTIAYYLSSGDSKSCCEKLESLLIHGCIRNEAKSHQTLKLQPFHHLSLNAYTTLASAYKVQASDLLALDYDMERHKLEAFNMFKKSAAYSLLLAGAAHHLFMFESSLVASVANFWLNAGESLFGLARKLFGQVRVELSSFLNYNCNYCCLGDTCEADFSRPVGNISLDEMKSRLFNCIGNITSKIWSVLASGSRCFLESIQNPIDFGCLQSHESNVRSDFKDEDFDDQVRVNLILLSAHCLEYGRILSGICFGSTAETP